MDKLTRGQRLAGGWWSGRGRAGREAAVLSPRRLRRTAVPATSRKHGGSRHDICRLPGWQLSPPLSLARRDG